MHVVLDVDVLCMCVLVHKRMSILKVFCLQHSKVHRMFTMIQFCLLLSLLVLIHAFTAYSMHIFYIKTSMININLQLM